MIVKVVVQEKVSQTMLLNKILETLEETVVHLSKIVYDTDELMSYKLKGDIIYYRKLTRQKAKYLHLWVNQLPSNKEGL